MSPRTLVMILVFGAVIRGFVYAADRSLLIDEAFISLNLERHSAGQLMGGLDWNQAAPIGFIEIEKVLTTIFGNSEYVLRAAPFAASLLALVLFARLAEKVVEAWIIPLAVLIFVGIALVTSYAAVAKPYSFDVVVVLALYLATIAALQDQKSPTSVIRLAIVGVIAPLFSFASVFVIAASATVVVGDAMVSANRRKLMRAAFTVFTWLVVLLVVYFVRGSTLSHLRRSFSSESISSVSSLRDVTGNLRLVLGVSGQANEFAYGNGFGAIPAMAAALCAGLFVAWGAIRLARQWPRGPLLLLPGCFALVASIIGWYPIFPRAMLFLAPSLAILLAEGFRALFAWSRSVAARSVVAGLLMLVIAAETASTVQAIQAVLPDDGMKPAMKFLAEHQRATDTVYLDVYSQYAFAHYLECRCADSDIERAVRDRIWNVSQVPGSVDQFAPALRSNTTRFRIGRFRGFVPSAYYEDFARLPKHQRVWLILTGQDPSERRALLGRLDRRGRRIMAYHGAGGETTVSLLLYRF
jgi:hypothetical protein